MKDGEDYWVEKLKEPCWCCGTPRAIIHNADGTTEETCFGRSKINKDRCVPPCKYFEFDVPRPRCTANGRKDGNCKGTKINKFEGRGYCEKSKT